MHLCFDIVLFVIIKIAVGEIPDAAQDLQRGVIGVLPVIGKVGTLQVGAHGPDILLGGVGERFSAGAQHLLLPHGIGDEVDIIAPVKRTGLGIGGSRHKAMIEAFEIDEITVQRLILFEPVGHHTAGEITGRAVFIVLGAAAVRGDGAGVIVGQGNILRQKAQQRFGYAQVGHPVCHDYASRLV